MRDLIPVDRPATSNADEIASLLAKAGFHPHYDRRPFNAVKGKSFAKTTIYVPKAEAAAARAVLAEWYAHQNRRISEMTPGMWRGLSAPLLVALGCGASVGFVVGQLSVGLAVAFVAFIPTVGLWHRRESGS